MKNKFALWSLVAAGAGIATWSMLDRWRHDDEMKELRRTVAALSSTEAERASGAEASVEEPRRWPSPPQEGMAPPAPTVAPLSASASPAPQAVETKAPLAPNEVRQSLDAVFDGDRAARDWGGQPMRSATNPSVPSYRKDRR